MEADIHELAINSRIIILELWVIATFIFISSLVAK